MLCTYASVEQYEHDGVGRRSGLRRSDDSGRAIVRRSIRVAAATTDRMLAPTMTARRAEQCGQHDTTVCDEHLTRHAARTGMMDRQEVAVGAAPGMVHVRGHRRVLFGAPLARQASADDAAIRRYAAHLKLQHATRLRGRAREFRRFAQLEVTPVRQRCLVCSASRHGFRTARDPNRAVPSVDGPFRSPAVQPPTHSCASRLQSVIQNGVQRSTPRQIRPTAWATPRQATARGVPS